MNDFDTGGWHALGEQWKRQPASRVDTDALLATLHRHGRHLRWALASELFGSAAMLVVLVWALATQPWSTGFSVAMSSLAGAALVFQGWSLWARRRQWTPDAKGVAALVELDIARTATTLQYWRISIWLALAMLVALAALMVAGVTGAGPVSGAIHEPGRLAGGLLASACVGAGFAGWAWWRCRQLRARLARMRQVCDALGDD